MTSEKRKFLSGNLDQMALSLSGGGVRAVGFHLGTMSMLRRLGLLDNVEIISTVSGGSLPGIGYSLAQRFERPFQAFFDDFYVFLPKLNILEQMLKGITNEVPPSPSGKRDLIAALANTYHEFYFQEFYGKYVNNRPLTFEVLMNPPGRGHLQEMIFNATEFKTGTAFRFQASPYRCMIGNGNISLCRNHASKIRIADIMAASSCIPVGMEPMFFPDDFHWPDDGQWNARKRTCERPTNQEIRDALIRNTDTGKPTFALMDGGVYDNQGITSTLLALNRRKNKNTERDAHECGFPMSNLGRGDPPGPEDWANWMSGRVVGSTKHESVQVKPEDLDLLIVSDTPVKKASFFPRVLQSEAGEAEPEQKKQTRKGKFGDWFKETKDWLLRKMTLGFLSVTVWILFLALGVSTLIAMVELYILLNTGDWQNANWFKWTLAFFHAILPVSIIVLMWIGLIIYKRRKREWIDKLEHLIPNWEGDPGKYINKLRVYDLIEMGALRTGSTAALTSAIYMDRIRGLGYSTAFSREDLKNKILVNEIFTLQQNKNPDDPFHVLLKDKQAWPPPDSLYDIVNKAANMQTKLWLSKEEGDPLNDLDYLVVCGQSTICYNLMKYMWEDLRDTDGSWLDPKMEQVFEHALTEWKKLMADPLSLLKDRKRKSNRPEQIKHAAELDALLSGS